MSIGPLRTPKRHKHRDQTGVRQQQQEQDRRSKHRVDDHPMLPAAGIEAAGKHRRDDAADALCCKQQPDQGWPAVEALEHKQWNHDGIDAPHDVQDAERQAQAAQRPVVPRIG